MRCADRTAVLKLIRLGAAPGPRWPSEPDPPDPYYWRREALVYGSGLLDGLDGLRAPRLFGLFEREDGSVATWLEASETVTPLKRSLAGVEGKLMQRPAPISATATPNSAIAPRITRQGGAEK